jgi:RNA polymerase sigma-70 factor (ECF subfamily)
MDGESADGTAAEGSRTGGPPSSGDDHVEHRPFASTRWTVIWRAAQEDPLGARPALAQLCERYWQPLYGIARSEGSSVGDAQDLVQEFFAQLLTERGARWLAAADPLRGRFRAFLLTAWRRFRIDQHRAATSQRHGGGQRVLSLDYAAGEAAWLRLADRGLSPEQCFERQWAQSLIDDCMQTLRIQYADRGQTALFDVLALYVTRPVSDPEYMEIAAPLQLSVGALRVALHRLRNRFAELIRARIAETVDDPAEVDAELTAMLSAWQA